MWEVDKTLARSKRLLPVVHIAVPDSLIPEKLSRLQFVRFDAGRGVTRPLQELADALRQDLNWISRAHATWGNRDALGHARTSRIAALTRRRYRRSEEMDGRPQRSSARDNRRTARLYQGQRGGQRPRKSGRERAQLKATARLRRITRWAFAAVGAMIVIADGLLKNFAVGQGTATGKRIRFLIDQANQWIKERDAGTAMLLALQAMPDMHSGIKRPLVHEAEATLFNAYQELQERIVLGHKSSVWSASIAPDGRRIVTASEDNTARVWDAENGGRLATLGGTQDRYGLRPSALIADN